MLKTSALSAALQTLAEKPYARPALWVNGRRVSIAAILQKREAPRSAFEESAFDFIRAWLGGENTFALQTSGSTGSPKTISISKMQMVASALKTADKIGLREEMRGLVCLDARHIAGKMMLARCLTLGLPIALVDPTANPLIKIPIDKRVHFTALVPYQISHILESKHPHLLNNLDHVLIGGAPLSVRQCEQLDQFQCRCYETYGMTETVSHIALRAVNTKHKRPYFQTLPGVDITQDARGCLVVATDYLPAPVITNDLVDIISGGTFTWLGRWDNVINTGGVKVMPEKIENILGTIFLQNDFHHPFFIAALPDEKLGSKIVLILEGVQFSSEILQRSLNSLKSAVTVYEFPKAVYCTPEFIRTASRKLQRSQTLAGVTPLLSSL